MEREWYYVSLGQQTGPVSESEIRRLLASGVISRRTLICGEGMAAWVRAGECADLVAPVPSSAHTPVSAGLGIRPAGWWQRVLAVSIDNAILAMFAIIGLFLGASMRVMRFMMAEHTSWGGAVDHLARVRSSPPEAAAAYLSLFVMSWLYHVTGEGSSSLCTPGERAVRIVVTDLKGARISFGRASLRWLGGFIPPGPLNWLLFWFTKRKQFFQDYISGCVFVKSR